MQNSSNQSTISLDEADFHEFEAIGIPIFVYLIVLCVVGTIGNLHVLIVYSLKYKVNIYKTFVLCLSTVDFLACVFCIPSVLYLVKHPYTVQSSAFCKVSRAAVYFVGACSLALLDVIAVERYRKVCQATRAQFTVRTARIVCAGVVVFVFTVVIIPVTIIYGINRKNTQYQSLVGYECTVLIEYKNSLAVKIYRGVIFFIFILLLIVCVVLYSMVGRSIYKRQNRHQKSQDPSVLLKCCVSRPQNHDREGSHKLDGKKLKRYSDEAETSSSRCSNISETAAKKDMVTIKPSHDQINIIEKPEQLSNDEVNPNIHPNIQKLTLNNDRDSKSNFKREEKDGKKIANKSNQITTIDISSNSRRKKINRSRNITAVFLVVSVISFGGYLPYLIFTLIRNVDWQFYGTFASNNAALDLFIKWMLFLNNAINPLVYGFMDKKFRKELSLLYKEVKTQTCVR